MLPGPMRLLRVPQPFDHPDFAYELKLDGFRALAYIEGGACRLVSRNGYEFAKWPALNAEIAASVRAESAVLDGEIVCLDADGRANFYNLLFRRAAPFYCAFDLLSVHRHDVRRMQWLERKDQLFAIMPRIESRVRYLDHIHEHGINFFAAACRNDLEGVVAKWIHGTYQQGGGTSWLKFKNPHYSQMERRGELFDARPTRGAAPRDKLSLVLA